MQDRPGFSIDLIFIDGAIHKKLDIIIRCVSVSIALGLQKFHFIDSQLRVIQGCGLRFFQGDRLIFWL